MLLSSCASLSPVGSGFYKPTEEEKASADYGPFPENYQELVKQYMQTQLKDPESARYRFEMKPYKGNTSAKSKEKVVYCWKVATYINAKNSYGGYTGEKLDFFEVRNGRVIGYLSIP